MSKRFDRYKALLFDLCGTVMPYDIRRLPMATLRGQEIRTTTPILYSLFCAYHQAIPYEQFHDLFVETTQKVAALRAVEEREITSDVRFKLFLERLDIKDTARQEIFRKLKAAHLNCISACLTLPEGNRHLLMTLKERYKIGLVTNFDDTDTVYHVLGREGILNLFEAVAISAEVGVRKPRAEIFLFACEKLSVLPREVLFIGDSWESDVCGAKGIGMDVVWINSNGSPPPEEGDPPDHILSDITELHRLPISSGGEERSLLSRKS